MITQKQILAWVDSAAEIFKATPHNPDIQISRHEKSLCKIAKGQNYVQ